MAIQNRTFDECVNDALSDFQNIKNVPHNMKTKEFFMKICAVHGTALKYSKQSQRDYQLCKTAVIANVRAIRYVPKDLQEVLVRENVVSREQQQMLLGRLQKPMRKI